MSKKKLIISLVIVVFLLVTGIGGLCLWFVGSPYFTIIQISEGYDKNNYNQFEKYFHVESVASNMADDFIDYMDKIIHNSDPEKPKNEWADAIMESVLTYIKDSKDGVAETIAKSIRDDVMGNIEVEQNEDDKIENLSVVQANDEIEAFYSNFKITDLIFGDKFRFENQMPFYTLHYKSNNGFIVDYTMIKDENYWKIVRIQNIPEILNYFDEQKGLVFGVLQTVFGNILSVNGMWDIKVEGPEDYQQDNIFLGPSTGMKYVTFNVEIKNNTNNDVSVNSFDYYLKDSDGDVYSVSWFGKEPMLESKNLSINEGLNGYITFEIPDTAIIGSLVYSDYYGNKIIFSQN